MNAITLAAVLFAATSQPATQPASRPAKPLPATYIDENADKLGPKATAWLQQVKFSPIRAPEWDKTYWSRGIMLPYGRPKSNGPQPVSTQVTFLGLSADGKPHTFGFAQSSWGLGEISLAHLAVRNLFTDAKPTITRANVHVAVLVKGTKVYEALLKYDKTADLKPNGVAWWEDAALVVHPAP
jgi:hypothetical protein